VRRLSAEEKQQLLTEMTEEIALSPVLSAFGLRGRFLRGRFYVEQVTAGGVGVWGRITPVKDGLLLEVEYRTWKEVATGSARELIQIIAGDTRGTFHGLGRLDQSLRETGQGSNRRPMTVNDERKFVYTDTGATCSVQEVLYHYFGLPVEVIAQPRGWYAYHRTPRIVECGKDRTRVLVEFSAMSLSGSFGGTCLYALRDGRWEVYTIRPSESGSIATAEAWLVKRKWKGWQ
jgi:hypothetical protein